MLDWNPLIITLETAVTATTITFFIGIFLAYGVMRMHKGQGLMDAIITLPLILPPTVVGFLLLLLFGKRSFIGQALLQWDIHLVFTWPAAVIAAIVVSLPLMYRTTRGAFEQLDPNIVYAARTLGLVLSFARTIGEFGATIMFAGNIPGHTQTMSTAIYAAVQANDYALAEKWAAGIILFSLLFILSLNHWLNRQTPKAV